MKTNKNKMLDKWENKITNLGPAKDDYDRLLRHYYGSKIYYLENHFLKNVVSFFLIPFVLRKLKKKTIDFKEKVDAVITSPDKAYLLQDEDLPDDLKIKFPQRKTIFSERNSLLRSAGDYTIDEEGLKLINRCYKKYRLYHFMILTVILHLGRVTTLIKRYRPKAIISTQVEQDFSSSIISHYCESQGVAFICVQHGEYCYNPSMAYMRFTKYYAWDKETIDIFEMTNNKIDFAVIYTPKKLTRQIVKKANPNSFITYYLSGEEKKDFYNIREALELFTSRGYKCCVRSHPRATNTKRLEQVFKNSNVKIEDSRKISINDSLADTKYIVSYRSTVSSEALMNNLQAAIDDVTQDYQLLERVNDPNIKRIKLRLSGLMKEYLGK